MRQLRRLLRSIPLLILAGACAPSVEAPAPEAEGPSPAPEAEGPPSAPWSDRPLDAARVPAVYLQQWRQAGNRATCAALAPTGLGEGEGATPRAATFAGGWGVAYDLPGLRSAFGIAGTGAEAAAPAYADWPFSLTWADGSRAEYGPEGGSGPNQLAYLSIEGQGCLYNVWSRLSRNHLEFLLGQLRFVAGG